jgi:Fe-S oxidoreductase
VGLCRKKREGTMCPSYMVTREEEHSTRGRDNTLRLAMAGQLGDAKLSDAGVHEVLDLCLECRACKSECPVGVDVARFKSEFLSGYWDRHVMSPAAQVFGSARTTAAWGSRLAPLSNTIANSKIARWDGAKARRHRSPAVAAAMDAARFASDRDQGTGIGDRTGALLFADTFTNHADPEIGLRDRRDECAGITTHVAPNGCAVR